MKHAIAAIIMVVILAISQTASAATISVEPSYLNVTPGEEFSVNITVYPRGDEIYGAQYILHFDNILLRALTQNKGSFLGQDGNPTRLDSNYWDNALGEIRYAETRIGKVGGVSGSGVLATIDFEVRSSGIGELRLDKVKLTDPRDAQPISNVTVNNGTVGTAPQPLSPFLINGYVFYENESDCNKPNINITNLNTSTEWQTNESYNYYQLMLNHGVDIVANETLQFDVESPDGSQLNTTAHTITQEDINNGGLFNFNISLELHDVYIKSDYTGAHGTGIRIDNATTEEIPLDQNLIIGDTYYIKYKVVNNGSVSKETVNITVRVDNATGGGEELANYPKDITNYHLGNVSWDTSGLAPGNYNITVNASICPDPVVDVNPEDNGRTRQVTLESSVVPPGAPNITDWYNNITKNNSTEITINESECVFFNATTDQPIDVWSWFVDDTNQSHNFDNFTYCDWTVKGTYYVKVNATNVNGTSNTITWTVTVNDITPPASITDLTNTTGNFWINWTWTNPLDADFNHTMVYIDGALETNITKPLNYYNGTYTAHARKTISTHTVDTSGNINLTWVNQTTKIPNNEPVLETIGAKEINETETLTLDVNATDPDEDTLTYSCNRTDLFADFNTSTGEGSWTPSEGQAGAYYVDFGVYDGYGGVDNETVKITVKPKPPINTPPWWDVIPDQTINEDASLTLNLSGYVHDNETAVENLTLEIVQWDETNFSQCEINETQYLIAQPKSNWFGLSSGFQVNATDEDCLSNESNVFYVNVTPVNDAPQIAPIANQTHRICDPWNVTINVTDVDDTITSDMITTSDPGNVTVYNVTTLTLNYTEIVTNKPVTVTVNDSELSDLTTFYVTTYTYEVVINEFEQDPPGTDNGNEWVEFYNNGSEAVNISNWKLIDGYYKNEVVIPSGATISGKGYYTINWTKKTLINSKGENITLYDAFGSEVDKTLTATDTGNDDRCWARVPNGYDTDSDTDWKFQESTRNVSNNMYNVSITSEPTEQTTAPDVNATYTLTITNLGNVADTIELNITDNEAGFGSLSADTFSLDASENATAYLNVSNPTSGIYNTTVRATSQGNTSVFDDASVKTAVLPYLYGAPNITAWYPVETEIYDIEGATRTFNVTINQTVNVSWLINGTEVFNQSGVNFSEYTNENAVAGYWNVTAYVCNENGSDMHTWWWTVGIERPVIEFIPPTPENETEVTVNHVLVNVTVKSSCAIDTVLLNWNGVNETMYAGGESYFCSNKTDLSNGDYIYRVYASDICANWGVSETRLVTVNVTVPVPPAPKIISYAPPSPVSDIEGAARTFNITVDQVVNVSWLINGTEVFGESGVTESAYTNESAVIGTWNVSAVVKNANGTDMHTWIWKVTKAMAPTAESFGVEDATGRPGTYVLVPVNITNVTNSPVLGVGFEIVYDKNVINITGVSKGALLSNWSEPYFNNNFSWGAKITIAGSHADDAIPIGTSGSVVILNFSVIGSPGDTSPMNLSNIKLSDISGNMIGTAPARNGTFTIPRFGSIVGKITYACNGTGIAGVVVNLTKEGAGAVVNTTLTNETGYYNFTNLIPDSYFVNASKLRFWDNSTEVTVIAGETTIANMILWLKGDLNNNCESADAGDLVLMNRASVGEIAGDWRYDLNKNGIIADIGDVVLMNRASVGEIELL